MHAALWSFNGEQMIEYSVRVYKLSKKEIGIDDPNRLWLASCASHTMHRFCLALKKGVRFSDKEHRHFACHCFSLLLNCHVLETASNLFNIICILFTYRTNNKQSDHARQVLQEMISTRPNTHAETQRILFKVSNALETELDAQTDQEPLVFLNGDEIDRSKAKNQTIKAGSPFTKHFIDIQLNVQQEDEASNSLESANELYNLEFVKFLQKHFMPYIFLWSCEQNKLTLNSFENLLTTIKCYANEINLTFIVVCS